VRRGAPLLRSESADELYDSIMSQWRASNAIVIGASPATAPHLPEAVLLDRLGPVERMMARDMLCYLPDDILVKVDRASMAVSLETRVPLLDPEIVEFAWTLPLDLKLRNGTSKWLLREVLYRHVPRALIERPKMGFGVPLDSWLRGPLREWADDLLDERRLRSDNYFEVEPVRRAWTGHLGGQPGLGLKIWTILMFQSWLDAERAESAPMDAPVAARGFLDAE
jgi:asparagine synthase (glutamine-hydrolysing)